jgi:DNA polymerase III subunit beta
MQELVKLSGDAEDGALLRFSGDDNHLFFEMGDRLLISRKLTGNFPDYERVLPKEHPHSVTLRKDELRSAIERVAQFADERSRAIRIKVGAGELRVHSSASETGESEETIPAEYSGPAVDIGFNAQYMLDFLRAASEENVAFHFRDAQSAGEMRPAGGDGGGQYRYIIMPMRI